MRVERATRVRSSQAYDLNGRAQGGLLLRRVRRVHRRCVTRVRKSFEVAFACVFDRKNNEVEDGLDPRKPGPDRIREPNVDVGLEEAVEKPRMGAEATAEEEGKGKGGHAARLDDVAHRNQGRGKQGNRPGGCELPNTFLVVAEFNDRRNHADKESAKNQEQANQHHNAEKKLALGWHVAVINESVEHCKENTIGIEAKD